MADETNTSTTPETDYTFGYPEVGVLNKEFTISKSYLYDYYQTNSGIYPKNPGPGVHHALQTDVDDINARLNNVADGVNDASNIDAMKTAINNLKK